MNVHGCYFVVPSLFLLWPCRLVVIAARHPDPSRVPQKPQSPPAQKSLELDPAQALLQVIVRGDGRRKLVRVLIRHTHVANVSRSQSRGSGRKKGMLYLGRCARSAPGVHHPVRRGRQPPVAQPLQHVADVARDAPGRRVNVQPRPVPAQDLKTALVRAQQQRDQVDVLVRRRGRGPRWRATAPPRCPSPGGG